MAQTALLLLLIPPDPVFCPTGEALQADPWECWKAYEAFNAGRSCHVPMCLQAELNMSTRTFRDFSWVPSLAASVLPQPMLTATLCSLHHLACRPGSLGRRAWVT